MVQTTSRAAVSKISEDLAREEAEVRAMVGLLEAM
jgi:hypothetical protein